jgi:prolyl-tRNA synthetase
VAAAIEQNHDKDGMILPMPIAPFQVVLLNLSTKDEEITQAAEGLYQECLDRGIEVLMDDRDERPGVKFKDADLIGIPIRLTVGRSFSKDGVIEIRSRRTGETFTMPLSETVEKLRKMIDSEMIGELSVISQ